MVQGKPACNDVRAHCIPALLSKDPTNGSRIHISTTLKLCRYGSGRGWMQQMALTPCWSTSWRNWRTRLGLPPLLMAHSRSPQRWWQGCCSARASLTLWPSCTLEQVRLLLAWLSGRSSSRHASPCHGLNIPASSFPPQVELYAGLVHLLSITMQHVKELLQGVYAHE